MPITKEVRLSRIEIREDEKLIVFSDHVIIEDGVEIASVRRGDVVEPDADMSAETDIVKDVASGLYTAARKQKIKDRENAKPVNPAMPTQPEQP